MNIKAIFPAGVTELMVNGLHQWDYGRVLEIQADDLPAALEVHFACAGMTEAVVRACSAVDGVATAVIPDECIEQTTPVFAWVFVIDDTTGLTTKKITLPVIPRTKPQSTATVPTEFSDKYTELMTAVNDMLDAINNNEVVITSAKNAERATADADGNNIAETYATKDELELGDLEVDQARYATRASFDGNGNNIVNTYATKAEIESGGLILERARADEDGNNIVDTYREKAAANVYAGVIENTPELYNSSKTVVADVSAGFTNGKLTTDTLGIGATILVNVSGNTYVDMTFQFHFTAFWNGDKYGTRSTSCVARGRCTDNSGYQALLMFDLRLSAAYELRILNPALIQLNTPTGDDGTYANITGGRVVNSITLGALNIFFV